MNAARGLTTYRDPMREWSRLGLEDRKRRAAKAINQRDHEELWSLAQAHLLFRGKKGMSVSHHTLRMYRIATLELLEHWRGVDLLRPSEDQAQDYVRWLEQGDGDAGPKAPATVNQHVVAIRNLYQGLIWCGFEIDNPFYKVRLRKDPTPPHEKRQEYGLPTVAELLEAADEVGDQVSKIVLMLGVYDGLRISEIVGLKWEDVDFQEHFITITGKGGKQRYVPLGSALSRELSGLERRCDYLLWRKYNGYGPFTTDAIRKRIDKLCVLTFGKNPKTGKGNGYKAVHSLRHSFGVNMQERLGLLELQALLGHADPATTARYSKVTSLKASKRARGAQAELEHLTGED
jgi:site-specific recombinase XerD